MENAFGDCPYIKLDAKFQLITETEDAMGNTIHYKNDYMNLQTYSMINANLNINKVLLNTMDRTVATAILGKNNGSKDEDSLIGLSSRCNSSNAHAIISNPLGETTTKLLGNTSSRIVHYIDTYHT